MAKNSLTHRCFCLVMLAALHWLAAPSGASPAARGQNVKDAPLKRLVSLAPSNTELIYALGAQHLLAGVCTSCDYPPQARRIEKAGSFTSVNLERISRLKPDIVLLVSGQEAMAEVLRKQGFRVLVIENNRLDRIASNLRLIGGLTGQTTQSERVSSAFKQSIVDLGKVIAGARLKPSVFFCVWPGPLLTVGRTSFLNDVITASGGINIAADLNQGYPHFSQEKLILSAPDVVILPHEAAAEQPLARQPWASLKAVREGRAFFLPEAQNDNLSRPTLRVVDGLFWLASRLHPELSGRLQLWLSSSRQRLSEAGAALAPRPD